MIVFNIQHKMENFKSVIPTCSTASCPKCSGNVTLKKHANSGSIANMMIVYTMGFVRIVPVLSMNSLFVLLVFSTPVHGVTIEIVVF